MRSKIKVIYIVLVKDKRLPESNFVASYFDLVQSSGLYFRIARLERAVAQPVGRINRQVPEVAGIPKNNAVDNALLYVRLAHVR